MIEMKEVRYTFKSHRFVELYMYLHESLKLSLSFYEVNNSSKSSQKLSQFGSAFLYTQNEKAYKYLHQCSVPTVHNNSIIYCTRISGSNSLTTLNVTATYCEWKVFDPAIFYNFRIICECETFCFSFNRLVLSAQPLELLSVSDTTIR